MSDRPTLSRPTRPVNALFLGGEYHGHLATLRILAPYYDMPSKRAKRLDVASINEALPDEILKMDRVRYKLAMVSEDRHEAVYTETGEGSIGILTKLRDWVVIPEHQFYSFRKPEPVFYVGRK